MRLPRVLPASGKLCASLSLAFMAHAQEFSEALAGSMPVVQDDTRAVALSDVDGDGDLDRRHVDIVFPFVSSGTARIPSPFGTIGIDPAFAISLPLFVVPQPAGVGSFMATIPNNPTLVGVTIHAQALLVQLPSAFLTNVMSSPIQP